MIEYRKGSLFDAPVGTVLAHACNGHGVWGGGIAAQFAVRFPKSDKQYQANCRADSDPSGACWVLDEENGYNVACLVTSVGYGVRLDPETVILINTEWSVCQMFSYGHKEVHMPKINSGLFGVPWEKTEAVLLKILEVFTDTKIVVWEL